MAEKKKEPRTRQKQKKKSEEFKRILDDNKINVLLLGTSGAGKSTLINALVDTSKEEASTGTGQAATHSIEVYGDLSGLDYRLIDTPGFEYSHKRQSEITKELKKWLKGSVKNPDPRTVAYAGRSEQSARHFRAGSPLIQSTLAGVLSTVANM